MKMDGYNKVSMNRSLWRATRLTFLAPIALLDVQGLGLAQQKPVQPLPVQPGAPQIKAPQIKYAAPIVITRGGVYQGNWQSLDSRMPAITIQTSRPVTIEDSNIQSRGHTDL